MDIYNNLLLGERINAFVNYIWIIWCLFNAVWRTVRPGKIPEFDTREYWQLPILGWNSIEIEMLIHIWIALLIAASVCNDWTYSTVLVWLIIVVFMLWLYVFILYCKLKVMFCWILRLFILLLGVYNSLIVLHCRSTFCDIKMCDWYRFIFQLPPNCLGEYFIFLSKYPNCIMQISSESYIFSRSELKIETTHGRKWSCNKQVHVRPGSDAELFMSRTQFEFGPTQINKSTPVDSDAELN